MLHIALTIVLAPSPNTLLCVECTLQLRESSEFGSAVPRKMDLNYGEVLSRALASGVYAHAPGSSPHSRTTALGLRTVWLMRIACKCALAPGSNRRTSVVLSWRSILLHMADMPSWISIASESRRGSGCLLCETLAAGGWPLI